MQEAIEKNQEKDDNEWLEAQIVGDRDKDIDMDGIKKVESYEWEDILIDDSYVNDNDDEDDLNEIENSESVQAHTYDRTFVVSGPVVKIYKEADH